VTPAPALVVKDGWTIYPYPLLLDLLERLIAAVE